MFIFLFTWAALNLVQSMLLYFVKYRLGLEARFDIIAGTVFVTAMLTLPIWEWLSRKFDKRRAYIFGMIFLSVGAGTVLAFIDPASEFWVILLLAFLAGIGVAAVHVLPWSMIPDAVEVDELETGGRHEGMYYSLVTLLRRSPRQLRCPRCCGSWMQAVSSRIRSIQTPVRHQSDHRTDRSRAGGIHVCRDPICDLLPAQPGRTCRDRAELAETKGKGEINPEAIEQQLVKGIWQEYKIKHKTGSGQLAELPFWFRLLPLDTCRNHLQEDLGHARIEVLALLGMDIIHHMERSNLLRYGRSTSMASHTSTIEKIRGREGNLLTLRPFG